MMPAPAIGAISPTLVRLFDFMVEHPDAWFTAEQLIAATSAPKSTIYRRFGNLTAAQALVARQKAGFRQFKLHPAWQATPLGAELHRRAGKPAPTRPAPP